MIYINHSFHNGFFHRVFDGSTAPRMRAQYPHLSHEYDHGVPRELPWGHYTVFGSSPGLPGKPTKAPLDASVFEHFAIVIPALHSRLSDRNQIWHTYSDGYGTDSNINNFDPPDPRGVPGGILGGQQFKSPGNVMNCPEFFFFLKTPPHPRESKWGFLGVQNSKVRKMSWTAQKINNLFLTPIPPCGWEF